MPRSQELSARVRRNRPRGKGMSKNSVARKTVRKSAGGIPPASSADLDRLRAAMQSSIDTSEIPERRTFQRLKRDASGKLPPRKSIIREAVARQMQHLHLTVYRLWQMARTHYPTLSQSAVHEFLKGQRQARRIAEIIRLLNSCGHLRTSRTVSPILKVRQPCAPLSFGFSRFFWESGFVLP